MPETAPENSGPALRLHAYYRSSTSYRLRIALNLKGLIYEVVPVNLLAQAQRTPAYRAINPFAGVPALEFEGRVYAQSVAMLEWLDERFPDRPLLPATLEDRFAARELAMAIATELHAPLNLPVLTYLKDELGLAPEGVTTWYHHWIAKTFDGIEARLADRGAGDFLFAAPGLFECMLVPQVYNARRFGFDMEPYRWIGRIEAACLTLPPFAAAHPDNQPDAPRA